MSEPEERERPSLWDSLLPELIDMIEEECYGYMYFDPSSTKAKVWLVDGLIHRDDDNQRLFVMMASCIGSKMVSNTETTIGLQ